MMKRLFLIVAFALFASSASAQTPGFYPRLTIAAGPNHLPAASTLQNKTVKVIDGSVTGDCGGLGGGGTAVTFCDSQFIGAVWVWVSLGDGTGAGGTVTNVTATSPNHSSGGSTPNISIDDAKADGSTKGASDFLAADFNDDGAGKISLDYTNGQKASASQPGFLNQTDWSTFNGKQSALSFTPENSANKDAANGYAGLDSGALLKRAEFPSATVFTDQVNVYTAGMKQSFQANGTNAGSRWVGVASDPGTLVAGDVWYNTTSAHFRANNGATKSFMFSDDPVTCSQLPAFTGDISTPAGSCTTTIGALKVLNSMLAGSIAFSKLLGTDRTLTAGAGLTGGGDLSADRTFNVGAGNGITVNADDVALTTPGTLTVSTANSSSGNHTHAITSSSNPGAAASLLATDGFGALQLVKLGINITPGQTLEVGGNAFIHAATANLFMKDTSTGWQVSNSMILNPQSGNSLRTNSYTSGLVGWNMDDSGTAEFNNVNVRGAIHAAVFVYNQLQATAGTLGVFKSACKLKSDTSVPSSPTYGTTTITVDCVDQEGVTHAASQLFAFNDILRLKEAILGDTWFQVSAVSDQTTFWRYTAIVLSGSNNTNYRAGLGVADYGPAGSGFIIQTADQANAPYLQMATHAATVSSGDASGSLVVTPRLRLGNLNGSYGYSSDIYGLATGLSTGAWIKVDPTNGVRIGFNTTTNVQIDASGNATFAGALSAATGSFAGSLSAATGTFAGSLSAASGTFAGSLTAASGAITGTLTMSGASSAIAIGSTPPTSASTGTGLWIDRNGLFALNANVVKTSISSTGVTAGAVRLSDGGLVTSPTDPNITINGNGLFASTTSNGTSSADGIILQNLTNGSNQWSPRLRFTANQYRTSSTGNTEIDFIQEVQPGSSAGSSTAFPQLWVLSYGTSNAGYSAVLKVDGNTGNLTATGTITAGSDIFSTGSLGATGSRLVKGWFTDLQVTNAIAGSITGSAPTLTTPRTIAGVSFDGSANITIASTNLSDTSNIPLLNAANSFSADQTISSKYLKFSGSRSFPGTASGNAYAFYNSGVGLWLYGKGSTYDVDITNAGGSDVISIPTGTTNVLLSSLAGTGSRAVLAAADGTLSAPVSDERLKTHIRSISAEMDVLSRLDDLRGVYFDFVPTKGIVLSQDARPQIGMVAQEVEKVLPEIVGLNAPVNGIAYRYLDYEKLGAFNIEVSKALKSKLIDDEDRIRSLEAKIADLEKRRN